MIVVGASDAVVYATAGSNITCGSASGAIMAGCGASAASNVVAVCVNVLGIRGTVSAGSTCSSAAGSGSLALDYVGASVCRDRSGEYVCDLEGEDDGGKDVGELHVG